MPGASAHNPSVRADTTTTADPCLTVRQVAARWRVAPRKVRDLIRRGLLSAFMLPGDRRRQVRIAPEAVAAMEKQAAVLPVKPRRRREAEIDPEVERLLAEA
ncbi:MAG: helix-turn-helix domain-containing protein [Planctomycetes bacterium]|nr:helix-turn-helix domain-containing protein [Planctomycetota bacterium]